MIDYNFFWLIRLPQEHVQILGVWEVACLECSDFAMQICGAVAVVWSQYLI